MHSSNVSISVSHSSGVNLQQSACIAASSRRQYRKCQATISSLPQLSLAMQGPAVISWYVQDIVALWLVPIGYNCYSYPCDLLSVAHSTARCFACESNRFKVDTYSQSTEVLRLETLFVVSVFTHITPHVGPASNIQSCWWIHPDLWKIQYFEVQIVQGWRSILMARV
jgi:hypothetical protein